MVRPKSKPEARRMGPRPAEPRRGNLRAVATGGFYAPSPRRRERIGIYGGEKVGKTTCVLQIANQFQVSEQDNTVWYLDLDFRVWHNVEEDWPDLVAPTEADEGPLVLRECGGWEELTTATEEVYGKAKVGDVIAVDLTGQAWEYVQEWFSTATFGMTLAEYLQKQREQAEAEKKKGMGGFDPNMWWRPVKTHYREWIKPLVTRSPAHVVFVAGTKNLSDDWDSKAMHDMYGAKGGGPGSRPDAEKHLGHSVHQVVYVTKRRAKGEETREIRVVGGTKEMTKKPLQDFAFDFLVEERGWSGYRG